MSSRSAFSSRCMRDFKISLATRLALRMRALPSLPSGAASVSESLDEVGDDDCLAFSFCSKISDSALLPPPARARPVWVARTAETDTRRYESFRMSLAIARIGPAAAPDKPDKTAPFG